MKAKKLTIALMVATLTLLSLPCFAGLPIGTVLNKTPAENVPFNATKRTKFLKGYNYIIDNSNNAIPDKMYSDVQCTQYTHAGNGDRGGEFFRKFTIPNSSNMLVAVAFGGVTDWRTTVLCVVPLSGGVISTLEAYVDYYPYVAVKQFRITAQNKIVISKIVPTSSTPIMFENFTSFVGQRVDVTYTINAQGQFVQVSSQTFPAKTYTRSYLENRDVNIWDDNSAVSGYQPSSGG
jgi:hypothetical protein